MKKFLTLLMVFCFLGVFTVSAAPAPVEEKQVMVFVLDVGLVTLPEAVYSATTDIANIVLYEPMALIYYGSKKIRYDTEMLNDKADNQRCRSVIKIGDTVPIAA